MSDIEFNKIIIWNNIQKNPNIYCFIPSYKQKYNLETLDFERDVNIQNIPSAVKNNTTIEKTLKLNLNQVINKISKYTFTEKNKPTDYKLRYNIIKDFIITKNRILYDKNYNTFYFISPKPWEETIELSNLLFNSGFEFINVLSFKNSYDIYDNEQLIVRISYSDINSNNLNTKEGMKTVDKNYIPMLQLDNLYKSNNVNNRFYLLKKWETPVQHKFSSYKDIFLSSKNKIPKHINLLQICYDFIMDNNLIFSGVVAYNIFVKFANGKNRLSFNYYDVYSEDAKKSCSDLLYLLNLHSNIFNNFQVHTKYYNYKAINKLSYVISYKGHILCQIFNIDSCLPIKYLNNKWIVGIDYLKYDFYIKIAYNRNNTENDFKSAIKYLEKIQPKKITKSNMEPFQRHIKYCFGNTDNKIDISYWISDLNKQKDTRIIFPDSNTITIKNVKNSKIIIAPKNK